ncbi:hypothetical protein GCM10022227_13600 [Streptomyces sedi]
MEFAGHGREAVFHLGWHGGVDGPDEQAVAFQLAQVQGEHASADAFDAAFQLGEPDRTVCGGDEDSDAPFARDAVEDLGDRARLVADLVGHIGVTA